MKGLIPLQQGLDRLGEQDRCHGVDAELLLQLKTIDLLKTFFRLKPRTMQTAAAVEDQTQGEPLSSQA